MRFMGIYEESLQFLDLQHKPYTQLISGHGRLLAT